VRLGRRGVGWASSQWQGTRLH